MAATLIVFTPLRTLLPGYLKQEERQENTVNVFRVDSLLKPDGDIGISGHTEINPTGRQLSSHIPDSRHLQSQPLSIARFAAPATPDRRTVRRIDR